VPRCGVLSLLQKTPHYRGVGEIAARLNAKLWTLVTGDWWWWWHLTPFSRPIFYPHGNYKPTRSGPFAGLRGCWFVLLYFAPCRPLPRPRRPLPEACRHTNCSRHGRRRPTPRFCAAGANGTNRRQCWSARRNATAIDSNSPKERRRED
jgi:hypothetical protein